MASNVPLSWSPSTEASSSWRGGDGGVELRELLRGRGGVGHPAAPPGEVPPRSPLAGTADSMALRASATLERTRARDLPCAVLESHVERRAAAPFNPFSHRSLAIARYENGTRKSRRASRVRHRPRTSARNANPGGRLHGGSLTADVNPATLSFGPEAKQGPLRTAPSSSQLQLFSSGLSFEASRKTAPTMCDCDAMPLDR